MQIVSAPISAAPSLAIDPVADEILPCCVWRGLGWHAFAPHIVLAAVRRAMFLAQIRMELPIMQNF